MSEQITHRHQIAAGPLLLRDSKVASVGEAALWNGPGRVYAANTMLAGRLQRGGPMTCLGLYDANLNPVTC